MPIGESMSNERDANNDQEAAKEEPDEDNGAATDDVEVALPTPSPIPEEILEKIPEPQRRQILQVFASMTSASMAMGNPLVARITGRHITDIIQLQREETNLDYSDRRQVRYFMSGLLIFGILVALGFATLLVVRQNDQLLQDLIIKVAIGLGGLGGGYGLSAWRGRQS